MRAIELVLAMGWMTGALAAQTPAMKDAGAADALAMGRSAMQRGDYAGGHAFFVAYVKDNPDVVAARLYLGESDLGLKEYDAAAAEFQGVLKKMPTLWSAHHGLAMAYAGKGDWAGFDRERTLNEAAQAANGSGVPNYGFDRIDHWKIGSEDYEVRYFPRLSGQSGVRYAFLHTAKDGKIDRWMQLDSSEADQKAYKEKHPKEAEAGGRAYSLNTYSVDAQGMTQALLRPYPDGEPNYQALRTDVIEALTKPADKK